MLTVTATTAIAFIMVGTCCLDSMNPFELEVKVNGVSTLKVADMLRSNPAYLINLKEPTQLNISLTGVNPEISQSAFGVSTYSLVDNVPSG